MNQIVKRRAENVKRLNSIIKRQGIEIKRSDKIIKRIAKTTSNKIGNRLFEIIISRVRRVAEVLGRVFVLTEIFIFGLLNTSAEGASL